MVSGGKDRSGISRSLKPAGSVEKSMKGLKKRIFEALEDKFKPYLEKNYVLKLRFDERARVYIIKIVDPSTNQVVREMPLEKVLNMILSMQDVFDKHEHGSKARRVK